MEVGDVGESGTSWLLAWCLGLVRWLYLLLSVVHRVAATRREDVQVVIEGRFIVGLNDARLVNHLWAHRTGVLRG